MDNTREVLRAYLEANKRVQAAQTDGQIMPVAILNTFLGAAIWGEDPAKRGEPDTLEELADRLNIPPQTLSTHIRYLGAHYRADKEGLELIEVETYPLNRRMKTFRLTPKGKALASQIAYILQGVTQNAHRAATQ